MKFIASIFWNGDERRVRALWRLVLQAVLLVLGARVFQSLAVLVTGVVALGTGAIALEHVSLRAAEVMLFEFAESIAHLPRDVIMAGAIVAATWLAGRFLDKRRFADFGFNFNKDWWLDLGFGLFLGAFLMAVIFVIELAAGWVTITRTLATCTPDGVFGLEILAPAAGFILVGIYEELLSRGYHLTNIAEGFNRKRIGPRWSIAIAMGLSSILFGLGHISNPDATLLSTFNLVLGGLALALGYVLTGELAIPIGFHIAWNFFEGNVFGFPVSGLDANLTTFIAIKQGGPLIWTGGGFGPEAGMLYLVVLALGCLLTVLWVRWRRGQVRLVAAIAEAPERPAREALAASEKDEYSPKMRDMGLPGHVTHQS